ncbi:hypothetical protein BCR39DRAFT_202078 [Naematelia encephala]|uniref:Poly(A) RNA polymerase mitochondrial-like central palm domain-containing protein n=1 Tax=Naematelia encephala TaxID=71784 RepID=A0A1Y2B0X1_9TREE|nr:hypothetical protein BCR39DRAFT_202078 [Naematelia encephala]
MLHAWASAEPTDAERQHTVNLLEQLSVALNARLGGPRPSLEKGYRRFEVDIFGSVSWGGETGQSGDLDLVVIDKDERQGYRPDLWKVPPTRHFSKDDQSGYGKLPPVYNLRSVARVLWSIGMVDCLPIVHASTPIIKFKDASNGQECDLNVNDLGGWYNSSLILHYCMISPFVLRPLIHALKIWASTHNLNDSAGARGPATMSSYCLALMAIAYLQHCGVLPNLQQDVRVPIPHVAKDTKDPDAVWVGWGKDQGIKALVGFERNPPYGWTPRNLTAADALRGFFEYFSTKSGSPRFDYQSQVVSILNGCIISRAEPQGAATRAESDRRKELLGKGVSEKAITSILSEARANAARRELSMGKGNIGIQPLKWGESKLVVQDPFLWSKNCAGGMTKIGVGRFQETINRTYELLRTLGSDTTIHDILNGVVSTDSPIPKSRSRNKSRSTRGGR